MPHLNNRTSLLYLSEDILYMQQAAAGIEIAPNLRAAQALARSLRLGFIPSRAFRKFPGLVFGCWFRGTRPSRSLWLASRQPASFIKGRAWKVNKPYRGTANQGKSRLIKIFSSGLIWREIRPTPSIPLPSSRPPVGRTNPLTLTKTANQSKSRLVKIFLSGHIWRELRPTPSIPLSRPAPSYRAVQPVNANENSQSR